MTPTRLHRPTLGVRALDRGCPNVFVRLVRGTPSSIIDGQSVALIFRAARGRAWQTPFRGRLVVVCSSGIDEPLRLAKRIVRVLEHFLHSVGTFALSLRRLSFGLFPRVASLLRVFLDSQSRVFCNSSSRVRCSSLGGPTVWRPRIANLGAHDPPRSSASSLSQINPTRSAVCMSPAHLTASSPPAALTARITGFRHWLISSVINPSSLHST